jgi:hypothetical protein
VDNDSQSAGINLCMFGRLGVLTEVVATAFPSV